MSRPVRRSNGPVGPRSDMQLDNWLLKAIEPELATRLQGAFREQELSQGAVLQVEGDPVDHVYFPDTALIGGFSALSSGEEVQTAMIGRDGALGVFEACGSRRASFRAEVQLAGRAWVIRAEEYRRVFERSPALREQ